MGNEFIVRGLDPVSGRVVQSTVMAESVYEAKQRAEAGGLEDVVVLGSTMPVVTMGAPRRAMALL